MLRRILAVTGLVIGVAVAGCTPADVAQSEQTVELTGVVRGVDRANRRVVIQGPQRTVQFRVSDEVRNFDQVDVGDRVTLDYRQTIAVTMADPNDPGEALSDTFAGRSPEGTRPAVAGVTITSLVVDLVSYDRASGVAVIRTPEGEEMSVLVARSMRGFASARQPGDRILVVIEEAVAVAVTETT